MFTGAFYGVTLPITHTGLLIKDFWAFINGNTVTYLTAAVFYPLPLARFCLFLTKMLFEPSRLIRLKDRI